MVRPGAEDFLNQMSKHYELVLFTAGSEKYANLAMKIIDPNGLISLRLYRQHTIDAKVKDLFTLGRDIDKTIIIDNAKISFEKQPDNGIVVESWVGDKNDKVLVGLIRPLSALPYSGCTNLKESFINLGLL